MAKAHIMEWGNQKNDMISLSCKGDKQGLMLLYTTARLTGKTDNLGKFYQYRNLSTK